MNLLSIFSAALLFWFAFRIVRRQITISAVQSGDTVQLLRSYRDALTFGFANPLTVLLFFAAFPALTSAEDLLEAPLLLAGIVAGVIGWYLSLSTVAAVLRERLSARALRYANLGSGLTLAFLGSAMLAHAVGVTHIPLR
jgi:threonine/homoserine/homoserine lactone efflux protein